MLTLIRGGMIYDPTHSLDGVVQDLYIEDCRIVPKPPDSRIINQTIDANGLIVMAGGIDIHSHIGGGKGQYRPNDDDGRL